MFFYFLSTKKYIHKIATSLWIVFILVQNSLSYTQAETNPIAKWELDESSWDGTSGEVADSSGNNFSGTAIGATSEQIGPTASPDQSICGYGQFNGNQQKLVVPYNQALNPDSFTISLWTKVEGSNGSWRSPITSRQESSGALIRQGFNIYAGSNNRWQFWTGTGKASWDVLTGPTVINNVWTHIAVTFSKNSTLNGIHSGTKKFYINGQLVAQKLALYQPNTAAPLIIGGGGVEGNNYFFDGSLSKVQLYNSVLDQNQLQTQSHPTNTQPIACSNYNNAANFNCVEQNHSGTTGHLYTKTTAQSFSLDVVALNDTSNIETSFASGSDHTVKVELVDSNTGNGSCANYSALNPAVSQNLTFTPTDAGTKTSGSMTSSTAYRSVKCRMTDTTFSPSVIGCSTDSFAIRPTTLTVSSNLTNTGSTGTPKAKTGEAFTITATATKGYTGTPSIDPSKIEAHASAITTGIISGTFNAASDATGTATGTGFTYSEVGLLQFKQEGIYDDSFTAVDQGSDCTDDFSDTPSSGKVGCKFGNTTTSHYFGRFTPDHFDVALNNPVFTPSCATFTYLGQPIKYNVNPIVTVLAKNTTGATTQNYTGDYWKIDPSDGTFGITPTYTEYVNTLSVLESSPPVYVDNGDGTGLLTFANTTNNILAITKNALSAPFDAEIALSFSLTDTDAIVVANVDGTGQVNPISFGTASAGNGISFTTNNKNHRWGRFSIDNVHGSELTPLSVPVFAEYYNGYSFVKNISDNCTSVSLGTEFSISDAADLNCAFATQTSPITIGTGSVKATLNNSTFINGEAKLSITDNADLTKGSGSGNTGHIDITTRLSNLPWLMYDWDGNGTHDNCPNARATFGIYKGNINQIYFKEVY